MITIYMKNVTSKIDGLTPYLKNRILGQLSYVEESFSNKSKRNFLFNAETCVTYTGLIPHVCSMLKIMNIEYNINDLRIKPEASGNFKILPEFDARNYQQNIVDNISSREIIQCATGGGKTYMMAKVIEKYNVKPVVVIAPKVSLVNQIADEFKKFFGKNIGVCGGGINTIEDITVCTPLSIPEDVLKNCKLIMWDEFHNAAAESIFSVGIQAESAYYRFGFSATPWRDDNKDLLLESITNKRKPHLSINASKLIKLGYLVPCSIEFLKINKIFKWNGSYNQLYKEAVLYNEERNKIIVNKIIESYKQNRTILVLIKLIEHGKIISDMLNEIKDNVAFLSGENSNDERNEILEKVKQGKIKVLISSTIADEGLDLPILDCLILAGGGKSSTKAFQRVGRVLRLYKNKTHALIYDFEDATPTLHKHYLFRKKLYETEPEWKIINN